MAIKNNIPLIIATCFFTIGMQAQYRFNDPVLITKEQGLPSDEVRAIQKSADGFMWVGTTEGLCRFDGRQIKVYKPGELLDPVGTSNAVHAILCIGDKIWVATNQGVSILNTKDESFHHYFFRDGNNNNPDDTLNNQIYESVSALYLDRQGTVWAGTKNKGVWVFDSLARIFKRILYPRESYPKIIPSLGTEYSILSLEQSLDNDSIIWAGTTAGLEKINKYTRYVEWYTFTKPEKDYQVALNAFRRLYHHDDGLLYVGSYRAGMNVFDPVSKTFTPLEMKNQHYFDGPVNSIIRKSKTELWITTSQGLYIYDIEKKAITNFWINNQKENKIYGINYIDDEKRIWTIVRPGIRYFDYTTQQFVHYSFTHLSNNSMPFSAYVGSDEKGDTITVCPLFANAIYKLNKATRYWTKLPFNGLNRFAESEIIVRGFQEITPGKYLVATDRELFEYSVKTGEISVAKNHPKVEYNRWGDILKDSHGDIWLCADADGLIRWNTKTGKYKIYREELTVGKGNNPFIRTSLLFEDSQGNVWFSRVGGFSVYLRARDSIVNFIYKENTENSFALASGFSEDRNGKIWVSSENGWFGYIQANNPQKGIIRKLNLREKNINGFFSSLATDRQGNVWGYTDKVLVRINADDLSFSTFSFEYGVKDPEFFSFSFLPSGEIAFGDRTGITLANIEELKRNTELPVPYISQVNLLNRPVNASLYSSELSLKYRQNFITIFFSAKAFTMPKGVKFRYRLKNFDGWNNSDGLFANYTNIPPGDYVFQLQAANNEGMWNPAITELPVYISRPWYLTWWFRIGFVLLVGGLFYWWYKYRINQVKKKEKLKTQYEKKLANVEMTALLAQMNPHFLFNSLNSIDSYIIKNESGKASEYLNNFARLMRLILQNSRSNYTSLKDEIELLELYMQMESLRFKDKFSYEIKVEEGLDVASIVIPPMLIQPYVENAIWHGLMHKKDGTIGKVKIDISEKNNKLVCVIEDNGIGREKAEEIKTQKPGNHKRSMGMQITRDRIDLINKLNNTDTSVQIIDLKDENGNPAGTRVELVIPY
ncbi:MAG TPA: two-component regulator propeller domain-containing protein [Chitinophagaceae bacterium]|nr:two-component regulator propeller domain-containing protein [Chitinophagaceae bacterium]